ncbi:MAG: hypothetical protein ABI591_26660 [Kofleriaceae bacterium]
MRLPIVIAVTLAACGATDVLIGKDCTSTEDQTWDITEPDAAMNFKIESCRMDVDACPALCTYMMTENNVSSSSGASGCDVEFEGGTTQIKATYEVANTDVPGCSINEPGGF